MTIYLGTDIVYIPRIQAALNRFGDRFIQRIYTQREQQDCCQPRTRPALNRVILDSTNDPQRLVYLAGRWAAKEAVAKALGTGFQGVRPTDIEIQRQSSGAPQVYLYRAAAQKTQTWGDCQWQLSISHDRDYCLATAIAWCVPIAPLTSSIKS